MKAPDPRARWEAVNRWLEVAQVDRNAAQALLAVPSLRTSTPFHCQQALEKLLKGFLTLAGKRGGKTHALDRLGAAAAKSFREIEELVAAARNWSDWAFVYRYPSDEAPLCRTRTSCAVPSMSSTNWRRGCGRPTTSLAQRRVLAEKDSEAHAKAGNRGRGAAP